jgi:hypothetical protein
MIGYVLLSVSLVFGLTTYLYPSFFHTELFWIGLKVLIVKREWKYAFFYILLAALALANRSLMLIEDFTIPMLREIEHTFT